MDGTIEEGGLSARRASWREFVVAYGSVLAVLAMAILALARTGRTIHEDGIGPASMERVVASGTPETVKIDGTAGIVCVAYPGMAMHQASHGDAGVSVVVDEVAPGVGEPGACAAGTRGVVPDARWIGWRWPARDRTVP